MGGCFLTVDVVLLDIGGSIGGLRFLLGWAKTINSSFFVSSHIVELVLKYVHSWYY